MASDQVEIINIVERGDAILVLNDGNLKLKVDTHMLRAASPVFKTMFGPDFADGQGLSYQTPKEIPLEDDAEAMTTICKIVHLKNDTLPETLAPAQMLALARIADKYFLQEATKMAMRIWLTAPQTTNLEDLLEAAILLDDPFGFNHITEIMILHHKPSTFKKPEGNVSEVYFRAVDAVSKAAVAIRLMLNDVIFGMTLFVEKTCKCTWAGDFVLKFMTVVKELKLSPTFIHHASPAELYSRIEDVSELSCFRDDTACPIHHTHYERTTIRKEFQRRLKNCQQFSVKSLCLDCMWRGEGHVAKQEECRIKHKP